MNDKTYENHYNIINKSPARFHTEVNGGWSFRGRWHEDMEILFIVEDSALVRLNNVVYTATPGDIIVINSSIMHSIIAKNKYVTYHCLIIDKDFCERYGFFIDENHINDLIRDPEIFALARNIRKEEDEKGDFYKSAVTSDTLKILTLLFRRHLVSNYAFKDESKNLKMVKDAMKYMKNNFCEPLSLDEIAEKIGYSKYHFCRCFKEITGSTVVTYMNDLKINYAYSQLKNTDASITDIATMCGFSDISYFTKTFKKHLGVLPSKVQRNKKEEQ
ncbi:MAG: helix-turn-helix transcriptional regulator [Clostridia bacterium]|nr:helix-turn-helix transcriptional regulator [Clostridia bacterium]